MDTKVDVYRELQCHLDLLPGGFPAVASGLEIKILKKLFTEEEAQLAVQLSMNPEPLSVIYDRVKTSGYSFTVLQELIAVMVQKGIVFANEQGYDEIHYSNAGFSPGGIFNLQVDRLDKDFLLNYRKYMDESRSTKKKRPLNKKTIPLRTIPIEESIPLPEKNRIGHYDDIRKLIESIEHPIAVANCICRQGDELLGRTCSVTDQMETCLIIGADHAKRHVDCGIGRYITKEETFQILEKAQKAGLILQPENSLKPEAVCCCCGDCCVLLKMLKKFPVPADIFASNYHISFSSELCTGCEVCVDHCQMEARYMVDGVAEVNGDRCIGCGNCVTVCDADANRLERKSEEYFPFKDKTAYNAELLKGQSG